MTKTFIEIVGRDLTGSAFDSASRGLKSVGNEALRTAAQITGIGLSVAGVVAGLRSVGNAGISFQRISNSLEAATGSANLAGKAYQFVRSEVDRLGLDLQSSAKQFSKLAASAKGTALEGEQVRKIFTSISQASTVLGLSADEAGGALKALEQIISKGKVSAEELRQQLAERIPGAFQAAARAIGVTTAELDDFLKSGKLTAEELLPKLAEEWNKTFGPLAEQAGNLLNGQINRFNTALFEMKIAIGETGLLDFLTEAIVLATDAANAIAGVIAVDKPAETTAEKIEELKNKLSELNDELEHTKGLQGAFGVLAFLNPFIPSKAEIDKLKSDRDFVQEDLEKLIQGNNGFSFVPKVKPIIDTEKAVGKLENSTRKAVSEGARFLESLKKQAREVGLTGVALLKARAAQLGITEAAAKHIAVIEKQIKMEEAQQEAARIHASDLQEIARITESVATAEERFADRVERLDDLLEKGLGPETYTRALEKAREEIFGLERDTEKTTDAIQEFWIQANRNIQTSLADGFFRVFDDGLSGMVDSVKNTVKRIIAEFAALKTAQALGLGTIFGGVAGASASSGSLTAGISNLFSAGSSLFTNFSNGVTGALGSGIASLGNTFGLSALSSFGGGLASSPTAIAAAQGAASLYGTTGLSTAASAGSGLAGGLGAIAGPAALAFAGTQILRSFAGDKRLGGGFGDALNFVGDIPILGDFVPVVPLINSLFGRGPLKQKESNLIGDVDSEGFDGATIVKFKAKGGLFRGNKTDRVINDTDSGELLNSFAGFEESGIAKELQPFADDAAKFSIEIGNLLDNTIQGMSRSIGGFVENLGGSADVVDTFATSINIATEKGEALSESDISDALDVVADDFARHALPIVDEFIRQGESAFDTLQRLSDEVVVLTQLGNALGHTSDQVKLFLEGVDTEVKSRFVDDAGGVQALNSQVSFFSQNFLDPQEQIAESRRQVEKELGELGLSLDTTKDQFRDLVQSFDPLNEASKDTVLSLLKIAPAFLAVKEVLSDAAGAALDFADAQKNITQLRSNLVSSYNRERSELQGVISEFDNLSNTLLSFKDRLRLGDLSPLTPGQKLDDARQQFNTTRRLAEGGDKDAIARLPDVAQSFLQASQTFNASGGTFTSDFNLVQSVLDSVGAVAQSEADIARLQLTELQSTVSVLTEIDQGVTTVDESIKELTSAVLTGLGNPDISDQTIRDVASDPNLTPQDLVDLAIKNNVSADQFINATGANPANVSVVTGGQSITDDQIREFVAATPDPFAIHSKALEFGISSERLASAVGISQDEILKFVRDNNLAEFQTGTDFVPNTGLALVHKGEAVTPSSVPDEIKLLREEIKQLREDQNRQTEALINVTREASQSNAKAIVSSNKETSQLNQWADRSAVRAG